MGWGGAESQPVTATRLAMNTPGAHAHPTCIFLLHTYLSLHTYFLLQCADVYVLPGVPQFFRTKLKVICDHFLKTNAPRLTRSINLTLPEIEIVNILNSAVAAHTSVSFGSYPVSSGKVTSTQ